jgi:hypothetical protein
VIKTHFFIRVVIKDFLPKEYRIRLVKKFVQPAGQNANQSPERAFIEKNGVSVECVQDANGKSGILQREWRK